jgi:hypothetical protein
VSDFLNNSRREAYQEELLLRLDRDRRVSQRSLASELGIALGLTNLLVRLLVKRGWVRIVRLQANQVRYLLTPAGLAQRAKISRRKLRESIRFYTDARDRIRERFDELAAELSASASKRVVFFGANQLAEIAWVCLQGTDFELVGVVDDEPASRLKMAPIHPTNQLGPDNQLAGEPFDRLIVMTFREPAEIRKQLRAAGFSPDRAFWL